MVDVGEGATTVIPVVDGYVLGGAVRSLPAAGRAVTAVVQQMMRWGRVQAGWEAGPGGKAAELGPRGLMMIARTPRVRALPQPCTPYPLVVVLVVVVVVVILVVVLLGTDGRCH